MHLSDEVAEHLLRDLEVGDHSVAQRPDGHDVAGRLPQHLLGLQPHGITVEQYFIGTLFDCHHRRLRQDNAFVLDANKGVRCPQVDAHIDGELAYQPLEGLEDACADFHDAFQS